jgi:hypothetical protein
MDSHRPGQNNIQELLKTVREECQRLREENVRRRAMLGINYSATNEPLPKALPVPTPPPTGTSGDSTPEKKIVLFRNLFRGRDDVFAVRWEGKSGKSGYSPAGVMDWRAIHASRPEERKKVGRNTRMLQPLTDDAIRNHLTGKQTIGVYPLLPNDTCWFHAVDFHKKSMNKIDLTLKISSRTVRASMNLDVQKAAQGFICCTCCTCVSSGAGRLKL